MYAQIMNELRVEMRGIKIHFCLPRFLFLAFIRILLEIQDDNMCTDPK